MLQSRFLRENGCLAGTIFSPKIRKISESTFKCYCYRTMMVLDSHLSRGAECSVHCVVSPL
jgi:hypothetical protein